MRITAYPSVRHFRQLHDLLDEIRHGKEVNEVPFEQLLEDVVQDAFEDTKILYNIEEE